MSVAVPQTVQASLEILRADRAIRGSEEVAGAMEERIARVVAVFGEVEAEWALVGAHAVGTLITPRATSDFDFVVQESKLGAILEALERDLGELDLVDLGPAVRLRALDVDLIRSSTHPLFQEALRHVRPVGGWKVPVPEVLIVLKFLAAVNPWRERTRRMYDVADLRALVLGVSRVELDGELMERLAAQVYPGAEREFEALLDRIERGDPISI